MKLRFLLLSFVLCVTSALGQTGINLGGDSGGSLPDQTGNSGEFLTTNGTAAAWAAIVGGGDMLAANNLSDLVNKPTARTNLGVAIGSNVQAYDADLTTYAGITPSANVQTFLGAADYAAMKTQLALTIGTNVQAYDADLTTYAGITPSADVQSLLGAADYAAMKTQLALTIGTNVQAFDTDLTTWSGVTPGTGVATALGIAVGSAGAPVLFNGAGGTPSSLTGTNISGTAASLSIGGNAATATTATSATSATTATTASAVAVGGITGLGTGVATALAVNTGSAGAPVLYNGAGGTPSALVGTNISGTAASLTAGHLSSNIKVIGAIFTNGGDALETGKAKGFVTVPFAGSITGWSISVDTGTATMDVWKIAAGTAVPTVSNKITTSGVSLSSGTSVRSTTVSDFATTVTAGDILAFNLSSVASATELTFELEITVP